MLSPRPRLCCALSLLALGLCSPSPAAPEDVLPSAPGSDDVHSQTVSPHKLYLRYVSPDAVLKELGWDKITLSNMINPREKITLPTEKSPPQFRLMSGAEGIVTLPEGVERVYAVIGDNSLLVFATPDGFSRVKDLVKNIDIAQRQVSIRVSLIRVTASDLEKAPARLFIQDLYVQASGADTIPRRLSVATAYGSVAAELYKALTQGQGSRLSTMFLQDTNGVAASVSGTDAEGIAQTIQVTPRISPDDTVTMTLTPPLAGQGQNPTSAQPFTLTRTVHTGETLMISNVCDPAGSHTPKDTLNGVQVLMFVTPVILDPQTASAATP